MKWTLLWSILFHSLTKWQYNVVLLHTAVLFSVHLVLKIDPDIDVCIFNAKSNFADMKK